jgi:NAD(P)-dependent dehydrogenase (short-subunit alcohol dehydrogenase family)
MKTLRGKCVVITGAGSGIGRALAVECARNGARLALCDVSEGGLAETVRLASGLGAEAFGERVDVSQASEVQRFAALVETRCGGADVIVNNAGVSLTQMVDKMSKSDMEWLFSINYWGVVHGCSAFLPQLLAKSEGHIVNVSSLFGLIPMPSQAAYVASKFAVRGYTESMRVELASTGVGVTCVHPGGVKTGIVRNGRHYETKLSVGSVDSLAQRFEKIAMSTPEYAARKIVRAIQRRKARLIIGPDAVVLDLLQRISPRGFSRLLITMAKALAHANGSQSEVEADNGHKAA